MKKILHLLALAALLLFVSGCTQPAPEVPPTPVPTTITPSPTYLPTPAPPTPSKTPSVNDNTVTIRKEGFSPAAITIKKGATVRWVNADSSEDQAIYNPTHRIKIPNVYDSPPLSPGQSWSWIFTRTGVFGYMDPTHPELQGTVTVE